MSVLFQTDQRHFVNLNILGFLLGSVPYGNLLFSKEARNNWETEMSNIIAPHLKVNFIIY